MTRFDSGPSGRRWRPLLTVGGWLVAAAAATMVGLLAVGAIGSDIAGSGAEPLSMDQVHSELATAPSPEESTPATANTPAAGSKKVLGSKGGTVLARCSDGKAELISWSPNQGYETDDVSRGPAPAAGIQFETDDLEINLTVTCVDGVPSGQVRTTRD